MPDDTRAIQDALIAFDRRAAAICWAEWAGLWFHHRFGDAEQKEQLEPMLVEAGEAAEQRIQPWRAASNAARTSIGRRQHV